MKAWPAPAMTEIARIFPPGHIDHRIGCGGEFLEIVIDVSPERIQAGVAVACRCWRFRGLLPTMTKLKPSTRIGPLSVQARLGLRM